ncbi:hypothetical protein BSKO_08434 [Bryopsis sp. KO-2023]|nr:hypothetical protein BSKO_08434 [Bryopsis sp. KO-2023]
MAERFLVDAISAIALFLVAVGGIYLPRLLVKKQGGNAKGGTFGIIFQLGNMLSAGVMLSAGFCHLLADALPKIQEEVTNFPLGPFLTATGYLLTLVADEIAVSISGESHHGHGHSHGHSQNHVENTFKSEGDGGAADTNGNTGMQSLEIDTVKLVQNESSSGENGIKSPTAHEDAPSVSFVTAVLLGAALSLHSVLEGAALGAQKEQKKAEDILIAILAHKGLAAYALGASLMDSETSSKRFWSVGLGFSIASPIGICLGYILSSFASGLVSSSLSALASGTFLYVAMMEVIPKELADPSNKALKIIVMLLGFFAMSILALWA